MANILTSLSSRLTNYGISYNSALLLVLINLSLICDCTLREGVEAEHSLDIAMPDVRPTKDDHYLCTALNIEAYGTQYVHSFEPNSNADRAHHMLLFTCDDVPEMLRKDGWWDCGHHYQACKSMRIIYAWAKNAPPTVLPKDVGFRIGAESNIKYLVLQVHYAHPLPVGSTDRSGFSLHVNSEEPKYLAGIMLMYRSMLDIPPFQEKIHGDMNCALETNSPIHPFAYRVHTHKLGVVVSGYRLDPNNGKFETIGKGNPQWPQAFYPTKTNVTINPKDYIVAQCTFSTKNFEKPTQIGMTAGDEMCNLYLMYYTKSRDPEEHNLNCGDEENAEITAHIPPDSDVPLPRNKTLEEHAMGHHSSPSTEKTSHSKKRPGIEFNSTPKLGVSDEEPGNGDTTTHRFVVYGGGGRSLKESTFKAINSWPDSSITIGQASGVDFDTAGNIVVFHRGDRVWDYHTFDARNNYAQKEKGPIKTDTVLIIDPSSGKLLHKWGKDLFYMPHDITVDNKGNFWLTDVALHQVFKFSPGSFKPSMILGKRFEPGSDNSHFCKPAAVAVMSNGDFFVADGYCNSRVIKFNSRGEKILEWGRAYQPNLLDGMQSWFSRISPPPYAFQIPHALALAEEHDLLCVADRENGRIQCFKASSGEFEFKIESLEFGGRLFSVAYSPANGGTLVAVNGPNGRFQSKTVQGFIISLATREISSVFKPASGFGNPHDVAISKDGNDIYVVEISQPYKVWKFSQNSTSSAFGKQLDMVHTGPVAPSSSVAMAHSADESNSVNSSEPATAEDSFGASVIIMAFLTIPLLLLIGIGSLMRLRDSGCCRRKETKSFSEFFPPSAGFEKLRMDESDSENSDTEVEEFSASMYRKASA
ncbi:Peptidyl-glycine alpha-amidating monooxygenase B [Orchesella cincta]|uniref:Peptidyl-glycine alpha-amidating monooxygenase B n=1 Tax=Orchesella cincta TaxID=48709 RepID=A0A1D2NEY4_ORCCI|nr:Peptidyl-glycine alpha-amidating monooxygenase B [Orchesella cincta]